MRSADEIKNREMSKEELRIVQERRRRVYVTKGWSRVYSRDRCVSGDREKRRSKARVRREGVWKGRWDGDDRRERRRDENEEPSRMERVWIERSVVAEEMDSGETTTTTMLLSSQAFLPGFSLESTAAVVLNVAFLTQVLLSFPMTNPALHDETAHTPASHEVSSALGMAVQSCL